ncbi:hypothetical protein PanWU01x14_312760 [Parasponia andersonii]|uniref:Uncharacterized protein n=1 Tax=Parasponia andersonii TaxID=3476 RepID=A0A2P5APB1_PARAD|nr:hypothetical protein PanWU01x14_312760 [Parasponia andersonii]
MRTQIWAQKKKTRSGRKFQAQYDFDHRTKLSPDSKISGHGHSIQLRAVPLARAELPRLCPTPS